jgi:hypothetical protein
MKKYKLLFIVLFFLANYAFAQGNNNERLVLGEEEASAFLELALDGKEFNIIANHNVAENQDIAIAIAEAVLFNIYGKQNIEKQKPYEVYLINNYWVIFGTLPMGWLGGTFKIIISEKDGRIILIGHDE